MEDLQKKIYTVAVMVGDTQSEYSVEMMRGFSIAAKEEGVNLVSLMGPQVPTYCTDIITSNVTGNYRYQFNSVYRYAHLIKPDALVISVGTLFAFSQEESKKEFVEHFSDIPCIIMEDESWGDEYPYLIPDNYGGMKACVEHLIVDHGYRNIAFLAGPEKNYDAAQRLQAYRDAMEQHGLEISDTMVVHGDYTDVVDDKVTYLLDNNPGLEAIVSANDGMTKSCYRVCSARNLVVGKDIAVTGFDDVSSCSTMNPPLTSVSQNTFQIAYTAIKKVVALCKGEKIESEKIPSIVRRRCSCGCSPMKMFETSYVSENEMESFLEKAVAEMAEYVFSSVLYKPEHEYLTKTLAEYFRYIYENLFLGNYDNFNVDYSLSILKNIVEYPYISNELVFENITQLLQILLANAKDAYSQGMLAMVMSTSQQFVHSVNIDKLEREIYISNRKAWFIPTFARDLASEEYLKMPQNIFFCIMEELKKMDIKSLYFCAFDTPVEHGDDRNMELPDSMKMVAYCDSHDITFYHKVEQPEITRENGFMYFVNEDHPVSLMPVVLFSARKQYGILMCEAEHEDMAFLQMCGVQLGTLYHFIELNQQEQQAQKRLENSLAVIQEQNGILSYVSEYDALTNLLNRRGFIEKATDLYKRSTGRKAYMIFGDLDHLKQINDIYGHAEGDFAIKNIADRFGMVLPGDAISGRIGGDEYVSFLLTDEEDFATRIRNDFAEVGKVFNAESDKPYYIELSLGIYGFVCDEQVNFEGIMKQSDKLLYEAKANRRASIQKEPS